MLTGWYFLFGKYLMKFQLPSLRFTCQNLVIKQQGKTYRPTEKYNKKRAPACPEKPHNIYTQKCCSVKCRSLGKDKSRA